MSEDEKYDAFCMACENGQLEVVKQFIDVAPYESILMVGLFYACRGGSLNVIRYLFNHGEVQISEAKYGIRFACERGHLEVVQLLVEHGCDVPDNSMSVALENGHVEVVNYLESLRTGRKITR